MAEPDLKACFSCMRRGDKDAFSCIYHALKQPVFTIAFRIVQSRETAEDITQDIFVKLFVSPPDASIRNPRAWVFQMTRNLAIDTLRKKACADIDSIQLAANDAFGSLVTRMDVEAAMRKLPRAQREILSLHLNGDLHFREIAPIVGLSMPAVYRTYRKALKILRALLDGGAV